MNCQKMTGSEIIYVTAVLTWVECPLNKRHDTFCGPECVTPAVLWHGELNRNIPNKSTPPFL